MEKFLVVNNIAINPHFIKQIDFFDDNKCQISIKNLGRKKISGFPQSDEIIEPTSSVCQKLKEFFTTVKTNFN